MINVELRIEALRAVSRITAPNDDAFGNLISRTNFIYEWLLTGKNPIRDEADPNQSLQAV